MGGQSAISLVLGTRESLQLAVSSSLGKAYVLRVPHYRHVNRAPLCLHEQFGDLVT